MTFGPDTHGPAQWGPPRRPARTGLWISSQRDRLLRLGASLHLRELAGDDWRDDWEEATAWIGLSSTDEFWGPLAEELARAPGVSDMATLYLTRTGGGPRPSSLRRDKTELPHRLSAQRLVAAGRIEVAALALAEQLSGSLGPEIASRADHLNLLRLHARRMPPKHPDEAFRRMTRWHHELLGQQAEATLKLKKQLKGALRSAYPELDPDPTNPDPANSPPVGRATASFVAHWVVSSAVNELETMTVRRSAADPWEAQWLETASPELPIIKERSQRASGAGLEFLVELTPASDLSALRAALKGALERTPPRGAPPPLP